MPALPDEHTHVVLFFTDNGAGLGHLTRLLAVARQARGRFRPVFLTMSLGYPLLIDAGMPCEYFPAYSVFGLSKAKWSQHLTVRVGEVIEQFGVEVVVVDHVAPPRSFGHLRKAAENVTFVWSRRGLWKREKNVGAVELSDDFDMVVEPGDVAAPIDMGATTRHRAGVRSVEPIVLVDPRDYLPRDEARAELGLPVEGRVLLLQIGDSSPIRLAQLQAHVRDVMARVSGGETIHIFSPLHPLHRSTANRVRGIHSMPIYPIARYYRAFDAVVSNPGYNSFHEIVLSGLPALFVSRDSNIDDQERRGRFGALSGRAQWLPTLEDDGLACALERMLSPTEVKIAGAVSAQLGSMSGANQFADLLAEVLSGSGPLQPAILGFESMKSGLPPLPDGSSGPFCEASDPLLLIALEHDTAEIVSLVEELRQLTQDGQAVPVIVAARLGASEPLGQAGLAFEGVLDESAWTSLRRDTDYASFVSRRLADMVERYSPQSVVTLERGQPLPDDARRLISSTG